MKIKLQLTLTPEEIMSNFAGANLMAQVKEAIEKGEMELNIEGYAKNPADMSKEKEYPIDNRWDKGEKAPAEEPLKERSGKIPPEFRAKRWLGSWLDAHNLKHIEAGQLCGLSTSTITRASEGFYVKKDSFRKICDGLGFTPEEKKEFKKSLTKHQRWVYE